MNNAPSSFVELIPRTDEQLLADTHAIASRVPCDGFNIPELRPGNPKFLSPEAVMQLYANGQFPEGKTVLPHLRTRDRHLPDMLARIRNAAAAHIEEVLLITGDSYGDARRPLSETSDVIYQFTSTPTPRIAVGIDPYRPRWGTWNRKIPAIHKHIVTRAASQPIFDGQTLELLRTETDGLLARAAVIAGITLIGNDKERTYWHERNNVPLSCLPKGEDDATIKRNSLAQAAETLREASALTFSTSVMLMRATLNDLETLFTLSERNRAA